MRASNELIGDKIEEAIIGLWSDFSSLDPQVSEYALLYNPHKSDSWFIVLYFADHAQLKKGLKHGTCYQVNSYLSFVLDKADELSDIARTIFFESGSRPADKSGRDNLYDKLLNRSEQFGKLEDDNKICRICGHSFDAHQLSGFTREGAKTPTEGWMTCPEEDCDCFRTWSFDKQYTKNN